MNQSNVESVKTTIFLYIGDKYQDKYRALATEVVSSVKVNLEGTFAAEVAKTVLSGRSRKCSEKQAWVIARAYVESCPKNERSALCD